MKRWELTPVSFEDENFAPFGRLVRAREEPEPVLLCGVPVTTFMRCYRTAAVDWMSAHDDGEQVLIPVEPVPSVLVVAPPSDDLDPSELIAFLWSGRETIVLHRSVWHALPIPVSQPHALYRNRQGSDWFLQSRTVRLSDRGWLVHIRLPVQAVTGSFSRW